MSTAQSGTSSLRDQRVARLADREVAPVWHDRFSRMVFRDLELRPNTFALDVHCASGRTTGELLQRLDDSSRVLAVESDASLINLAKARVRPEWKSRVYFKPGNFDDVTAMADDTYDLTIANLVLNEEVRDWRAGLAELLRVTKPGGQIAATLPLHGTWGEVEDLFEEVLRDYQLRDSIRTLQHVRRTRPRPRAIADALMEAGVDPEHFIVEHDRFQLLFRSGREFLFAPVIEQGPLRIWKAMLGQAKDPQKLFWRFKETVDTYYAGRVLAVTVMAGLVRVRLPGGDQPPISEGYWSRFPDLDRIFEGKRAAAPTDDDDDDLDMDIDMDMDIDLDVEDGAEGDEAILDDGDDAPAEPMRVQAKPEPAPEPAPEEDEPDTDAIFAAMSDDGDDDDNFDDLDAAFGDAFDMTQETDASAIVGDLAGGQGDEPTLVDMLEPETDSVAATPPPRAPAKPAKPPSGAGKSTKTGAPPVGKGAKIPPPPPTGSHKKVRLPPLPNPKKKKKKKT